MQEQKILTMLFELSKAIRFCHQEKLCGEDITFIEFNIINLIYERKDLRMSELHQLLAVEKSTTTRLIEPLVKKRLVIKEKSSQDSRAIILKLTEEGENVRNRAWECLKGFFLLVESNLPEGKKDEVYHAVKIYTTALQCSCRMNNCCC